MTTQQKIINFFYCHPEAFVRMVSEFYAFQPHEIKKHFEQLDTQWLSRNKYCNWDSATIHQFKDQLDWSLFSSYSCALGDNNLIDEFITDIIWKDCKEKDGGRELTFNRFVPWSEQFIEKYENYLDFRNLSWCKHVPWTEPLIAKYHDRWDWNGLSANGSLPWTEEFIDKYQHLWDWGEIIFFNDYFPWSVRIAKKYFHKLIELDKDFLLDNGQLWSNVEILEEFADFVDWKRVANNGSLPWYQENLLERWKDRLKAAGARFIYNRAFMADPKFFEDNLPFYFANNSALFSELSFLRRLPWSLPFIERFKNNWAWEFLSTNEGLPWSMALVDQYLDRWSWGKDDNRTPYCDLPRNSGLINNEAIPWDIDWILKYKAFINVRSLCLEPMIWDKAFKPYMDEKMLNTIFRLL